MQTRIPLPGNMIDTLMRGADTGSSLYSRIMQPILARERQKQLGEQFNRQQGQLDSHFNKEIALRNDSNSRQNDLQPLRSAILEQKLINLKKNPDMNGSNKSLSYHGAARDAYDLERLRQEVGDDSQVYKNALNAYNSTIDSRKDLSDLRARTKQGLRPGEKEFFDESTGEALGKEIPLTPKEREREEGNILFNELYPYVYKGASPFSGEGSINRLENAAANYKTNPEARKIFDDFLLAEKMLAATTVNESSTLNSGKTNRTYAMLKESLDAQDIPNVIKKLVKQYQIPPSASLRASMRYQKALSDARQKSRKGTAATQKLFYNPEIQSKYEQHKQEEGISKANLNQKHEYHDDDMVKVKGPNGIEVMPYSQFKKISGAK